ncbi:MULTISPECIES: VOC family protein [Chryseobacterium]|uniref:VOC family protein n=1 Tax=Chryseobacterium TaxID=59732 RepID=UPI00047F5D12|nr:MULTISPECIES: VOC family protein [Chryseobacterium]
MKIDHYGFATKDLAKSTDSYLNLGYQIISDVFMDEIQRVKIIFIQKDDDVAIELVEPLNASSPVVNILKKNGNSLYHTCYQVEDMALSIKKLKQQRFVLLHDPVPAVAFNYQSICFMFHSHVGLIELVQKLL